MTDTPAPQGGSSDVVARYIEKFGFPTAILCVVSYIGYSEVIKPITLKYVELVEEVKNSNKTLSAVTDELRINIKAIAESNGGKLDRMEERLRDIDGCVKRLERLLPTGERASLKPVDNGGA
jgi:hypothetical protein